MNVIRLSYLSLLCLYATTSVAQKEQQLNSEKFIQLRREFSRHPPKAILVEIATHERLKEYYTNTKQTKKLTALNHDVEQVKKVMVADFNDNFKFCPVYYFYDTTVDLVKQQKFEQALLDKDLKPAKNIAIQPGVDSNYFIVYFGKSIGDGATYSYGWNYNNREDDKTYYSHASIQREAQRLVVLYPNFTPLPQYTTVQDASGVGAKYRRKPGYSFNPSSRSNIYYWGFASILNNKFNILFNNGL